MPHRMVREGDEIFVRGRVLTAAEGTFQVRFDDGNHILTVWVPSAECAKVDDIVRLRPSRHTADPLTPFEPLLER